MYCNTYIVNDKYVYIDFILFKGTIPIVHVPIATSDIVSYGNNTYSSCTNCN